MYTIDSVCCTPETNTTLQVSYTLTHTHTHTLKKETFKRKTCLCIRRQSSVQLLSRVRFFVIPRTAARQASLSITNSWGLPKLMSHTFSDKNVYSGVLLIISRGDAFSLLCNFRRKKHKPRLQAGPGLWDTPHPRVCGGIPADLSKGTPLGPLQRGGRWIQLSWG